MPRRARALTYDSHVREAREGPPAVHTTGHTTWLWLLVGILAVVCAVGGMQVAQTRDARARDAAQHARYAEAMAAASDEATAFVNVDHETAEEDLARIAAGATGPLKVRYTEDVGRIVRGLRRDGLVTEGEVLWTGVVRVDAVRRHGPGGDDGHPVRPADEGTCPPASCGCVCSLVPVDGEWLTSEIEQVD